MADEFNEFDLFSRLRKRKASTQKVVEENAAAEKVTKGDSESGSIDTPSNPKPPQQNEIAQSLSADQYRTTDDRSILPSVDDAVSAARPKFKEEHEKWKANEEQRQAAEDRERDRMEERQRLVEPASSVFALPEITWHVPMTSFDYLKEEREKAERKMEDEVRAHTRAQLRDSFAPSPHRKGEDRTVKKISVKDKERAKRQRGGQSSQTTWKSEGEMRLRQSYD